MPINWVKYLKDSVNIRNVSVHKVSCHLNEYNKRRSRIIYLICQLGLSLDYVKILLISP